MPYYSGIGPLKFLHQELYLIKGADQCLSFTFKTIEKLENGKPKLDEDGKPITKEVALVDMPYMDKETLERYAKATVVKNAGVIGNKIEIPPLFYILMFIVVAIGIFNFLISSGRLKL
jgi:hypothetical protein